MSDEPGGRMPAPGALAFVQEVLNTNDIEAGDDRFRDAPSLARWLAEHGFGGHRDDITGLDRQRFVDLREALREVVTVNSGGAVRPHALSILDRAAREVRLGVAADDGGAVRLAPAGSGLARAIGTLLLQVHEAMADGSWQRLKICARDACRWAYYDSSRNRSGVWCSMAICGNREKGRAYRERRGRG